MNFKKGHEGLIHKRLINKYYSTTTPTTVTH